VAHYKWNSCAEEEWVAEYAGSNGENSHTNGDEKVVHVMKLITQNKVHAIGGLQYGGLERKVGEDLGMHWEANLFVRVNTVWRELVWWMIGL